LKDFDVVHFHDLYQAISPRTLAAVAARRPVVLTVHDCSAFTGGCVNPMGCQRFRESCGACPQAARLGRFDFTRWNLKEFRRLGRRRNVSYLFPSQWILDEAARSLEFAARGARIPNGFDGRDYRFCSRAEARRQLGIARDQKVVAIASASLDNELKGVRFALRALAANQDLGPLALVIGEASPGLAGDLPGKMFRCAGFVEDRRQLGLLHAAADLLLYPSLGDNLPITVQEAMAAATPVLAFEVGGVPELVRAGRTGWLIPPGDQDALNRALRERLQSGDAEAFGARARNMMGAEYSHAGCVRRHLDWYQVVIDENAGREPTCELALAS
jgi:glycosyltransferase involved in cell wall biosynthesis